MTGGSPATASAEEAGGGSPAVPVLLGAMTVWGATYVVTKAALPEIGAFTILLLRLLLGTAVLMPFAWRRGYRPRLSLQPKFVLFGLTGMVLHLGSEILGLRFTSASSAALIIATAPVVTAGFAIAFLGEKVSLGRLAGIALSIAGAVVITGATGRAGYPLSWLGNALVFAGVLSWGVFTVQGKRMAGHESWLVSTTAATGAAIVMTIPLAAGELWVQGAPHFTPGAIAAVLYLGVAAQAVAYALWNLALQYVDGSVAGAYVNLVPVIGVLLAIAVGETLTPVQLAGGVVVAAGVWLTHRSTSRSRTRVSARIASPPLRAPR